MKSLEFVSSVILAVLLGVLGYFDSLHEKSEVLDAKLTERLSQDVQVPLECPPQGQQKVTILADSTPIEVREQNMVMVVKQWPAIWPSINQALQSQAGSDAQKADLSRQPEIKIALPTTYLGENARWSVHYSCPAGSYRVELTGFAATSASVGR